MPKLEPKIVQRELEQGNLWPLYWLYGQERMKSRELLKRIRRAALGDVGSKFSLLGMAEETLDGAEIDAARVVEAAQSPSLGGGIRLIVVRDAHALKNPEVLLELAGPRAPVKDLASVCVFLSKDLDQRKKFSKALVEKAAVVACDEVAENEREAWIGYLAKRRGLVIEAALSIQLASLDPWGLDIVDQELEKLSLADGADVIQGGVLGGGADAFLEAFFSRDLKTALIRAETFASKPDEALPLLGLLSWNVRQFALHLADLERNTRTLRLNPYVAEKMHRWAKRWKLSEVLQLQLALAQLDFGIKQTPKLPLGLWTDLVTAFTRV